MRGRILKILMVLVVLIPVGLTAYLANNLYHRKGVPEALHSLTKQLFQSKADESRAEKRAQELEHKTKELQSAYDALVADLHGEVDAKEIRVKRFREKLEINFVDKVLFASGSAEITPHGREILVKVAGVLVKLKDKSIYVDGHTDDKPIHSALYPSNWELSTARSSSVIRFLSETGGVPPERFTAMGRAFYQPVASNATPEGRQDNRRVDIIVTEAPIFGPEGNAPEAQTEPSDQAKPAPTTEKSSTNTSGLRERTLPEAQPAAPTPAEPEKKPVAPDKNPPAPTPTPTGEKAAPQGQEPAQPAPGLPPVLPDKPGTPSAGS